MGPVVFRCSLFKAISASSPLCSRQCLGHIHSNGSFPTFSDRNTCVSRTKQRKLKKFLIQRFPRFWEDNSGEKWDWVIHLLEKAMATHSSTLAWKIPWKEEPGRWQSMRSRRVGHTWATSLSLFTFMHWRRKWQPTPVFLPGESQGWRSLVGCRL